MHPNDFEVFTHVRVLLESAHRVLAVRSLLLKPGAGVSSEENTELLRL